MDLNYLYHRHQISLFRAENALCHRSRLAHQGLVAAYAARIAEARKPSNVVQLMPPPTVDLTSIAGLPAERMATS